MTEFEEIAHTGGKITINRNGVKYEHCNPHNIIMYDILLSYNGMLLGRGTFGKNDPQPSIQVMIASDKEGYFGYICPRCSKYFRAQNVAIEIYCPYCLYSDDGLKFLTNNQIQYIKLFYEKFIEFISTGNEIIIDLDSLVANLNNNIIKLNSYEERMQLIIECKKCKTKTDIIGGYGSCPRCTERNTLKQLILDISDIQERIENSKITSNKALTESIEYYSGFGNDLISILQQNIPLSEINKKKLKEVDFQKIIKSNELMIEIFNMNLYENGSENFLKIMFQRRHIIVHNNSIVDQKYLDLTSDETYRLHLKHTDYIKKLV